MKLDILAFGAHPDDVEISAAGTLISHVQYGKTVGVVDLTAGEMGTRGSGEIRLKEAEDAAKILGLAIRENLHFSDCFFENDRVHQTAIIKLIRKYRPEVVLANAIHDRHPDHGRGSQLVSDACFKSGLRKIETSLDGELQEAWRPRAVYHYIQDRHIVPSFVVDISNVIEQKMDSITAYASQFYNPGSEEPDTYISSRAFLDSIRNRAAEYGRIIGVNYAEAFTVERFPGVRSVFDLL